MGSHRMGWHPTYRLPEFDDRRFCQMNLARLGFPALQIIEVAKVPDVNYEVYYLAVRRPGDWEVYAVLLHVARYMGRLFVLGLTERDNPIEIRCPIEVLEALTPTSDDVATWWRARARSYAEERLAAGGHHWQDEFVEIMQRLQSQEG